MRKYSFFLSLASCYLLLATCFPLSSVQAAYVLPYPSTMPGSKLYVITRFFDRIEKYWSFGSIAGLKYTMNQSDKTLVESKTLFEYSQYFLGLDALSRSDTFVQTLPFFIGKGTNEGKDMTAFRKLVENEMMKHREVLSKMRNDVPEEVFWQEEKKSGMNLPLRSRVDTSIRIRTDILSKLSSPDISVH